MEQAQAKPKGTRALFKSDDVNSPYKRGQSPLWIASLNGSLGKVKKLIEAGADVNEANKDNVTPLYIASEQGHRDVVQTLLGAGARVNIATSDNNATPLYVASQNGHDDVVQTLLGASAGVNIATSNDNVTPLYVASQKGHRDVVQTLLGAGARVNIARSNDGSTPLDIAVQKGHKEIIELLKLNMSMDDGLTEQSNLKPSEIKQPVEHKEVVTFASTHGDNIRLEHGGQVACRFNNNSRGIVMTSAPLRSDVIFQVEIMEVDSKWSGSLSIGVTTQSTAQVVSVDNVKQLLGESFIVTSSVNGKPSLALYAGGQEVDQLPDEINFHDLKVGDTVGLLYTNSGTLHLFMNGAHVVTLPCTVPVGVYGLVDLYGQCVKVSLRPLTPWSGGSPLHVMADKSALDQQRKQLEVAQQLYEEAMKQGSVKMSIIKCLVLGIAGVGKTHLKRLLLSGTVGRISTGLADNPIQAFVGSISSILAGVDEEDAGKWEIMDEAKLTQLLTRAYHIEPSVPPITTPHISHQHQSHAPTSKAVHDMSESIVHIASTSPINPPVHVITSESELHTDDQAADEVGRVFIEALKNITETKVPNVKVVHFIDSGGQPQFLELLPAFVQDVSAILFAVNLSERLDHCPMIYFYGLDGQPVGEPYQSPFSHKQVLEQCVRAAHARDVHPQVFVVGTHRDKEHECSEKREDKNTIISNIEYLVGKNKTEVIWDINGKEPKQYDREVANDLRQAIVIHCSKETSPPLPMKWFGLEMQMRRSATRGVLSLSKCLQLAQRLGMDEQGLEAALLHMVKYNLFLWYHKVPALKDVVFTDPQVILKVITDLVQCKHELAALGSIGVKGSWHSRFKNHAIVSHEFLSLEHFKSHFGDGVFTIKHFTALMSHLFIMAPLEDGDCLMPALLDPLSSEKICSENQLVDPLLVCFSDGCAPYGIFSSLIAFLHTTKYSLVEEYKVPVCLYRNCVSFQHRLFPARFTIIDSVAYIEVHLDAGDAGKACPRIRTLIHEGIKKCAEVLHYSGWKDLKDGFICSNESCKHVAIPYEEDSSKAICTQCQNIMTLTNRHTVWCAKEGTQANRRPTLAEMQSFRVSGEIVHIITDVADNWRSVCMAFNFDPAGRTLKRIEQQFPNKPEECCREMFQTWLKTKGASWKSLIAALESSGEDLLADYVKTYIGLAQEPTTD